MKTEKPYEVIFDPDGGLETSMPEQGGEVKSYRGLRVRAQGQQMYEHTKPPGKGGKGGKGKGKGKGKKSPSRRKTAPKKKK